MADEPLTIPMSKVADLIRELGIETPIGQLVGVHFRLGRIEVIRYRTTPSGRLVIAGDEAATETIVIGIEEGR